MSAKESYRIIINEDFGTHKSGTQISNQTFDQQMDFLMDNFDHKSKFKIESEQPKITTKAAGAIVKKSDTELFEDAKERFMDGLTAGELSSIREGKKKICHNQQVGFYLRLMSSKPDLNEIHVSLHDMRSRETRKVYESMKAILLGHAGQSVSAVSSRFFYHNDMFDESDLKEMIEDLFKGKC